MEFEKSEQKIKNIAKKYNELNVIFLDIINKSFSDQNILKEYGIEAIVVNDVINIKIFGHKINIKFSILQPEKSNKIIGTISFHKMENEIESEILKLYFNEHSIFSKITQEDEYQINNTYFQKHFITMICDLFIKEEMKINI